MCTCALGDLNVIKHVYDRISIDINALDNFKNSAFLYSLANENCLEISKFLVEKGTDPLVKTLNDNFTALHIALLNVKYEMLEYLLKETAWSKVNLKSIQTTKFSLIQLALSREINEDAIRFFRLLLRSGADVNEKNLDNEIAFCYASNHSYNIIYALLSYGADVNAVDSKGRKK